MSSLLPDGLKSYPVSRYFIYLIFSLAILASLLSTRYIYYYSYDPFIKEYRQFWRLFTYQISFINESEVLIAAVLLYNYRALERLFSSHRYCSLIMVLYIYNLIVLAIIIPLKFYTRIPWFYTISSGPTGILFGLLAHYREHIPVVYIFEIYGTADNKIVLTDQFLVYLLSFQLSITQGWSSFGHAFLGWVLGDLIVRGILPGKSWRIPLWRRIVTAQRATSLNRLAGRNQTPSSNDEDEDEQNREPTPETRTLTSQFLDTFRR